MSDKSRRTVRTTLQTVLGLAAGLPLILSASGVPESLPGVGVTLAVAAGATRVMNLDVVDRALPKWLRKEARESGAQ